MYLTIEHGPVSGLLPTEKLNLIHNSAGLSRFSLCPPRWLQKLNWILHRPHHFLKARDERPFCQSRPTLILGEDEAGVCLLVSRTETGWGRAGDSWTSRFFIPFKPLQPKPRVAAPQLSCEVDRGHVFKHFEITRKDGKRMKVSWVGEGRFLAQEVWIATFRTSLYFLSAHLHAYREN